MENKNYLHYSTNIFLILYKREGLTIKAFTFRLEGGAQGSKKNIVMTKAPSINNWNKQYILYLISIYFKIYNIIPINQKSTS